MGSVNKSVGLGDTTASVESSARPTNRKRRRNRIRWSIAGVVALAVAAVGVIEQGKLIFAGALSELMQRTKVGKVVQVSVEARTDEAAQLLRGVRGVAKVDIAIEEGGRRMDVQLEPDSGVAASELAARLLAQGFRLSRLQPEEISLETAFMRVTKGLVS